MYKDKFQHLQTEVFFKYNDTGRSYSMNKTLLRMLCVLFFVVILVSAGVLYFTFDVRALVYLTTFKGTMRCWRWVSFPWGSFLMPPG